MAATVLLAPFHASVIVLYCIARLAGYVEHWLVDALSYALPIVLLLAVLHFPGAIWRRSPFLLSAAALPLIVFVALYGSLSVPRIRSKPVEPVLTVMSYNVWGGNNEFDQIVEAIEDLAPDVIGFQEITERIAVEIRDDLNERYPYQVHDGDQAVFSRYPIIDYEALLIGDEQALITVQHVDLDVNGKQIGIVNAHPHSPALMSSRLLGMRLGYPSGLVSWWRDLEVRELMNAIDTMDGPLIVLGDFNLTDMQFVYGEITQVLLDAHKESGYGLGLTRTPRRGVGPATWRIDFVFYTPELVALSTAYGEFAGSDHRPVVAELAFANQ